MGTLFHFPDVLEYDPHFTGEETASAYASLARRQRSVLIISFAITGQGKKAAMALSCHGTPAVIWCWGSREEDRRRSVFPDPSPSWCPEEGGSQSAAPFSPGGWAAADPAAKAAVASAALPVIQVHCQGPEEADTVLILGRVRMRPAGSVSASAPGLLNSDFGQSPKFTLSQFRVSSRKRASLLPVSVGHHWKRS